MLSPRIKPPERKAYQLSRCNAKLRRTGSGAHPEFFNGRADPEVIHNLFYFKNNVLYVTVTKRWLQIHLYNYMLHD